MRDRLTVAVLVLLCLTGASRAENERKLAEPPTKVKCMLSLAGRLKVLGRCVKGVGGRRDGVEYTYLVSVDGNLTRITLQSYDAYTSYFRVTDSESVAPTDWIKVGKQNKNCWFDSAGNNQLCVWPW